MTNFIENIRTIGSFEQKCLILKGVFKSEQLKQHMLAILVYNLLSNSALCEHICLENIKKLYKSDVKFYDQQQYKVII